MPAVDPGDGRAAESDGGRRVKDGERRAAAVAETASCVTGLNILLVGHACLPETGSEPGITWNWAWHLAARNRVWVIAHGFARESIEQYLRANPRPNLHFIWVGPLGWWDPWPDPARPRGIRLHYLLWRHAAVAAAERLLAAEPIDLVHHVSWSTISAPPLLWRTGKPFVWGPIGGGQIVPWRFLPSLGRAAAPELLRSLRIGLMPWAPNLRRAVARADLLLAVNRETAAVLRRAGAQDLPLLPDIGIQDALLATPDAARPAGPELAVLWAGRIQQWKGLALCLEVARAVRAPNVRFLIAGWGRDQHWAERYVGRFDLGGRVAFLGRLSWHDMQRRFAEVDLFLFTSLRDTLGSVNFEAMAKGCPVMCLDHTGLGSHLPPEAAIKVPVTTPREAAATMAREIDALAGDRPRLRRLSAAAYRFAVTQQWDNRAIVMERYYRQLLGRETFAGRRASGETAAG